MIRMHIASIMQSGGMSLLLLDLVAADGITPPSLRQLSATAHRWGNQPRLWGVMLCSTSIQEGRMFAAASGAGVVPSTPSFAADFVGEDTAILAASGVLLLGHGRS